MCDQITNNPPCTNVGNHISENTPVPEWMRAIRFGIVGASGIFVNLLILICLVEFMGIGEELGGLVAIECAIISNFILNDLWTFRTCEIQKHTCRFRRLAVFNIVSVGGALINIAIYIVLINVFSIYYPIAQFIGILFGFVWNFTANRRFTWTRN